jgi:hypothetical protein
VTVYVDAAHVAASVENGPRTHTSTWCHLMADGNAELVAFAVRIGLRRNWIQREGSPFEHFDVTAGKRWQSVRLGAVEIDSHEAVALIVAKREGRVFDLAAFRSERGGAAP